MASSGGNNEPSWVNETNDKETSPLMGSGEVALQETITVVEETPQKDEAVSYGATDEAQEETKKPDWHEEEQEHVDEEAPPAATKKKKEPSKPKKGKKKTIRMTQSLHDAVINKPHRSFCLHVFYFIQAVAILASVCLLITQVLPLFVAPIRQIGPLQIALRVYISFFCIIFILVEYEVPLPFLQNSQLLQSFFTRGFLYSFVGLTGMEMAYSLRVQDVVSHTGSDSRFNVSFVPMFMQISSWFMAVTGLIYMVMGILCLKGLRKKLQDNYQERLKEFNEQQIETTT